MPSWPLIDPRVFYRFCGTGRSSCRWSDMAPHLTSCLFDRINPDPPATCLRSRAQGPADLGGMSRGELEDGSYRDNGHADEIRRPRGRASGGGWATRLTAPITCPPTCGGIEDPDPNRRLFIFAWRSFARGRSDDEL